MQLQIRKEQNIRKEDSGEGEACMGGGRWGKKEIIIFQLQVNIERITFVNIVILINDLSVITHFGCYLPIYM